MSRGNEAPSENSAARPHVSSETPSFVTLESYDYERGVEEAGFLLHHSSADDDSVSASATVQQIS
jgi:hypothetical protein